MYILQENNLLCDIHFYYIQDCITEIPQVF